MSKKMINLALIFFLLLAGSVAPPRKVTAQEDCSEKKLRALGVAVVTCDGVTPPVSACGTAAATEALPRGFQVYMIGDSITEGAKTVLTSKLSSAGADSVIDGVSSRSLTTGDEPTNGISVLESSSDSYSSSSAIVVALGTNGGVSTETITETITIIKSTNSQAKIFWVNIGANNELRTGDALPTKEWNDTIEAVGEELDIIVIDWASTVASDTGNSIIKDDGLGVHPTVEGNELFASKIVNSVAGGDSACSATTLTGADNAEKVWNYMIAKGLQPFQVAGFMGNMQAEAGFEPRRTEYAFSNPPYLSDTVPPCANEKCQPGFGIVQWTAVGRKEKLTAFAETNGKLASDLGLQLDFVWEEIQGGCCNLKNSFVAKYGDVTVLEALTQTTTLEEATDLILRNYEIPADMGKAIVVRTGFARTWLSRLGTQAQ